MDMLISEAIKELEGLLREHGDIPVGWDWDGMQCFKEAHFSICSPEDMSPLDDSEREFLAGRKGLIISD